MKHILFYYEKILMIKLLNDIVGPSVRSFNVLLILFKQICFLENKLNEIT